MKIHLLCRLPPQVAAGAWRPRFWLSCRWRSARSARAAPVCGVLLFGGQGVGMDVAERRVQFSHACLHAHDRIVPDVLLLAVLLLGVAIPTRKGLLRLFLQGGDPSIDFGSLLLHVIDGSRNANEIHKEVGHFPISILGC